MEDNPWSTMEMDMRSNNLKTFTALQGHFTRDARDQAGDSIMCIVVADFSDMMLRDMIYKKSGERTFNLHISIRSAQIRFTQLINTYRNE